MSETPLFAAAALGWRAWRFDGDDLMPLACLDKPAWRRGENLAECPALASAEHVPGTSCTCGFYAHHEYLEAKQNAPWDGVFGAVAGYGRVQLHATGWRAERARVVAIVRPAWWRRRARRMARAAADSYRVPLVSGEQEVHSFTAGSIEPAPAAVSEDYRRGLELRERAESSGQWNEALIWALCVGLVAQLLCFGVQIGSPEGVLPLTLGVMATNFFLGLGLLRLSRLRARWRQEGRRLIKQSLEELR